MAQWEDRGRPREPDGPPRCEVLASVLEGDIDHLQSFCASLRDRADASETVQLRWTAAAAWTTWLTGHSEEGDLVETGARLSEAQRRAKVLGDGPLVVELQALRALLALAVDNLSDAVDYARRASRMGRSEGSPTEEILANIVLARVRRFAAMPHLSLRILHALYPHSEPRARPWICWEATMAGQLLPAHRAVGPALELGQLLRAARRGAASEVRLAAARLGERARLTPFRKDADGVCALLLDLPGDLKLERWRRGQDDEVPPGLAGLAFLPPVEPPSDAEIWSRLIVGPTQEARRYPAFVTPSLLGSAEAVVDRTGGPRQPRVAMGVAHLARQPEGQALDEYFAHVYGFPYDREVHEAVLSVHLSRMRHFVGDHGVIERSSCGLRLRLHDRLILEDPWSQESLPQRALRTLAANPGMSSGGLATALQISRRSVQRLLKDLLDDGTIEQKRSGRRIIYQVEDTTFSEPTRSQLHATGLIDP